MKGTALFKCTSGENLIGKIYEDTPEYYMVSWLVGVSINVPQGTDLTKPAPPESQIVFYPPSLGKLARTQLFKNALAFVNPPLSNILQAYNDMLENLKKKYGNDIENVETLDMGIAEVGTKK